MGLEQLFWSTYYEKDASILVQDVLFQALKQTKVVEEEVKKLQTVPQVINKGIETLNQTLCPDCKSKLLDKTSPPQGSITKKKDSKTIKRLPIECQSVIKQMEILLIKKERLNKEGDDAEEYGTNEEWYQQTISDLRAQHERDVKGLRMEVDQQKREAGDAKRREQELEERYEKKDADLQKSIDSYKISMVTKNRTIENMEADRKRDRLRIKRLENDIKILDKRIIELSHPNPQEKSTQTELSNLNPQIKSTQTELSNLNPQIKSTQTELSNLNPQIKSTQTEPQQEKKSWSLFGGGVSKDELNAERIENEKLRNSYRRILQQREQAEKALQEKNNQLVQLNQSYRDQTKQITDLQSKLEELIILKEENAKLHSNIQNAKEKERKTEAALQEKNIELARLQAWKEELNILKEENAKLHSDIQNAKEKERKTEAALQEKNFELERVHSQLDKIQNENTNLDANLQHKAEEQQKEKKQLDDSRQEIQHLLSDLNEQDNKLKTLREQLEQNQRPRRKTIVMGLHCNRSGLGKTLVDMVVTELKKGVQDRLDSNNINLAIQFSQTPSEVTSWLQIVLCLNMSRVGTNILDSVKGIKGDRDIFVLVLHHTSKNNLSSLTPTNHRVTGSEIRQLGGILDLAFSSDSGLYECELNNNTFDKLASLLRKYILL